MAENGQDNSDQLKNIAGSRSTSVAKGKTMHWFAYVGPDPPDYEEDTKARLKSVKERENEERQKKLDELKAQAQAAQRFKEKKEMERKQRIEEMKLKEDCRRQQVEERKKMMNEAERDRLEAILRRNQEREARIEAKKRNERHSMVFAFGSSTPRMLQPTDSIGSFWGHRRATSTQNITSTAAPLTRRQSERELDGGSKKRATSAGGLERSIEDMRVSSSMYEIMNWEKATVTDHHISSTPIHTADSTSNLVSPSPQVPAGCASGYVGRRRTDLMPTIPSRESPSVPSRKSFTRSPGRAYSMSRLDQLAKPRKRPELPVLAEAVSPSPLRTLNRPQQSPVSRSMSHLAVNKAGPQPQRPLRKSDSRSMHQLSAASPLPPPRTTRAAQLRQQKLATGNNHEAPSRPSSSLSQQSTSSITSSVNMRMRPIAAPRRPRPVSIAVTGISSNGTLETKKSTVEKPPLPKTRKSSLVKSTEKLKKKSIASPTEGSPKLLMSPTSSQQVNSPVEVKTLVKEKTITKEAKNDEKQLVATIIATEEFVTSKSETANDSNAVVITETTTTVTTNDAAQITEQLLDLSSTNKPTDEIKELDKPLIPELVQQTKEPPKLIEKEPKILMQEKPRVIEQAVIEKPIIEKQFIEKKVPDKVPVIEKPPAEKQPVEEPPVEKPLVEKPPVEKPSVEKPPVEKPPVEKLPVEKTPAEKPILEKSITEEKVENGTTNSGEFIESSEMTTSMTKVRINTEEEAKAALAERRRLAREEAERQAEMERQRIAEEERLERERQQREEEQQRILIEKLRQEEEQRLQEAIKEAKKREEEEIQRREEENRIKLLKEESERRAREEAERQKAELQERLKNEEKEREARRKRVEAIMLRTRGKNNSVPQQQTEEKNEENKSEKINGSKVDMPENGHKNGKDIETVDNIIPVETLKNANNVDNLSTDDTLNSNNAWQHNSQTDLLM